MKKVNLAFLSLMIIFALSSCHSIKVITDYDKTVDFSKYKTFEYYGWAEESDKILNQFDKDRIEKAFGEELSKRSLKGVKENGDLVVSLYIVVEQKTKTTATTNSMGMGGYGGYGRYYGYGPGWGYGSGYSTTTIDNYEYEVGTLVISVYDKAEKKLIWEGSGEGTISDKPEKRDKTIPLAAQKIMREFPITIVE